MDEEKITQQEEFFETDEYINYPKVSTDDLINPNDGYSNLDKEKNE